MQKKPSRKIVFAAGGTGGHLFPAQALARDLLEKGENIEVLFAGSGLSSNRCFQKELFPFRDISASTPYKKRLSSLLKSCLDILKGIKQSFRLVAEFQPDLIVGFGSFHAFPLLFAAFCKRIPIFLFEPNSIPGKVNRLFSRWAVATAIQFPAAADLLVGKTITTDVPLWNRDKLSPSEARAHFGLDANRPTCLVFGGSLGAVKINQLFGEAVKGLGEKAFQIIHVTGKKESVKELKKLYAQEGIAACVKEFEEKMAIAWQAADAVVCRAGAATVAEQMAFEVPAIFIPYPHGAEDHQTINAKFGVEQVGGAIHLPEAGLTGKKLGQTFERLLDQLGPMREKIRAFKKNGSRKELSSIILEQLKTEKL